MEVGFAAAFAICYAMPEYVGFLIMLIAGSNQEQVARLGIFVIVIAIGIVRLRYQPSSCFLSLSVFFPSAIENRNRPVYEK